MRCSLTLLPALVLAVSSQAVHAADLVGIDWHPDNSSLLRIDKATGDVTPIGLTGFSRLNSLATDPSGRLYSVGRARDAVRDDQLIRIDPVTGAGTAVSTVTLGTDIVSVRGLAIAPDGTLYVENAPQGTSGVGPHDLWRLDASGAGTLVGHMPYAFQSLDFGPDGRLYGWEWLSKSGTQFRGLGLVQVNTETAEVTDVAPTVDSVNIGMQGIVFSTDGNLYGVPGLLVLDPTNGAVRDVRGTSTTQFDVRGVEEINVPEPAGTCCAIGWAAAALLRRRRR
jgi:hypothetical protein